MLPAVITHHAMTSAGASLAQHQGPVCNVAITITIDHVSVEHCAAADLLLGHRIMVCRRVRDLSS